MTAVWFYHMTVSTLDEALPDLLQRSIGRGWRAVVQAGGEERRDALDQRLWTFSDDSFLAHGTDREPHAAEQPVFLTTGGGNPNGAQVRFLVDGASPPDDLSPYERVVLMFDGHDASQLDSARGYWKALKGAGHDVTYWQQTEARRWERRA